MKVLSLIKAITGFVALSFGIVGVFLPIWPTTPFVLLAIGCFSGMPHIRNRILKITIIREFYEKYNNKGELSKRTVISSIIFLWGMLLLSVILVDSILIALILFVVGVAVTIHILMLAKRKIRQ